MRLKRIFTGKACYYVTTDVLNRKYGFTNRRHGEILIENVNYYRKKYNFKFIGYVIMPTHFHGIFLTSDKGTISEIMRDLKGYTAKQINELHNRINISFWQDGFYDPVMRDQKDLEEKLNYIHYNPVRAKLVEKPEDYLYSSYRNYFLNDDSVIVVDKYYEIENWMD
jgi:putative transposase